MSLMIKLLKIVILIYIFILSFLGFNASFSNWYRASEQQRIVNVLRIFNHYINLTPHFIVNPSMIDEAKKFHISLTQVRVNKINVINKTDQVVSSTDYLQDIRKFSIFLDQEKLHFIEQLKKNEFLIEQNAPTFFNFIDVKKVYFPLFENYTIVGYTTFTLLEGAYIGNTIMILLYNLLLSVLMLLIALKILILIERRLNHAKKTEIVPTKN